MPLDFRASAQPDLKLYDLGHLGLPPLHPSVCYFDGSTLAILREALL
jgi:hypothetical protein